VPDQSSPNIVVRIWQIYDDQRLCRLYEKYFERKTSGLQWRILILEIFIIIGTSTTGVAGWAFWNKEALAPAWAIIAGVAITLSTIKPILNLDKLLIRYNGLFLEYGKAFTRYTRIVNDISFHQGLTDDIENRYESLTKETDEIVRVPIGHKLLERLKPEVNSDLPYDKYWSPPQDGA
jgi:hypothetical protein